MTGMLIPRKITVTKKPVRIKYETAWVKVSVLIKYDKNRVFETRTAEEARKTVIIMEITIFALMDMVISNYAQKGIRDQGANKL